MLKHREWLIDVICLLGAGVTFVALCLFIVEMSRMRFDLARLTTEVQELKIVIAREHTK